MNFEPALANRHAAMMSIGSAAYTANAPRRSRRMLSTRFSLRCTVCKRSNADASRPMMHIFQNTGDPS
jgi:hypothetical protein